MIAVMPMPKLLNYHSGIVSLIIILSNKMCPKGYIVYSPDLHLSSLNI